MSAAKECRSCVMAGGCRLVDPRCVGQHCTWHCKTFCEGACIRVWEAKETAKTRPAAPYVPFAQRSAEDFIKELDAGPHPQTPDGSETP